ncbi:MAG TPA: hypothetical protein VEL82_06205 [Thermoplasmata archaeon]|nr:hypothetical protein [Thermoplasmata archaeon]
MAASDDRQRSDLQRVGIVGLFIIGEGAVAFLVLNSGGPADLVEFKLGVYLNAALVVTLVGGLLLLRRAERHRERIRGRWAETSNPTGSGSSRSW